MNAEELLAAVRMSNERVKGRYYGRKNERHYARVHKKC